MLTFKTIIKDIYPSTDDYGNWQNISISVPGGTICAKMLAWTADRLGLALNKDVEISISDTSMGHTSIVGKLFNQESVKSIFVKIAPIDKE